jgi:hypothetical protein
VDRGAAYGQSTPDSFASYDPDTSSWRTSQTSFLWDLGEFSETWPRAGTMRNGTAYPRSPLVPLTGVIGCSLLPTPQSTDAANSASRMNTNGNVKKWGGVNSLGGMAATGLWPTPNARDYKGAPGPGYSAQLSLPATVKKVEGSGRLNPQWVEWLMGFPVGYTNLED